MKNINTKFYPIIYVRGYAMTEKEKNETTSDPFNGFNIGSTVYRAAINKEDPTKKFIFESPLVRLISDYGYSDVYTNGLDITDLDEWDSNNTLSMKSVIIYRYYDESSTLLGTGENPDIEKFAKELGQLILRVRDLVCAKKENEMNEKTFKCYLVAHSMGGLICRAFLQNPKLGDAIAKKYVDKVFTYATPHNGIDMAGLNAPKLNILGIDTFNRNNMAKYLNLLPSFKKDGRVDWLPEAMFSSKRFFCMVGTNRADYDVAFGLSRTFAGHGSDGLVKIENASVWGINSKGEVSTPCATAYTNRAHSGFYGIVNSEDAYQNLTRFLFGDVRVDIWVDIDNVQLPIEIKNKQVNALYQFELDVAPKGMRWFLTQRKKADDSAACRTYQELTQPKSNKDKNVYLSTIFLSNAARIDPKDPSLSYLLKLDISALEYEVKGKFWRKDHFEGASLFHGEMIVKLIPPTEAVKDWNVDLNLNGKAIDSKFLSYSKLKNNEIKLEIPFGNNDEPGIEGKLRFVVSTWND